MNKDDWTLAVAECLQEEEQDIPLSDAQQAVLDELEAVCAALPGSLDDYQEQVCVILLRASFNYGRSFETERHNQYLDSLTETLKRTDPNS